MAQYEGGDWTDEAGFLSFPDCGITGASSCSVE